ncbi:MAG: PorV/PorQ family protein [candidate division KSB1 bacterium]|nr:PorV/PorQ family protein [candidate division KSB1 bacterium]
MNQGNMLRYIGVGFVVLLSLSPLYSQEKLAQTGFNFLSVGSIGRASAMGETFTTVEGVSSALFYNPAGLARMNHLLDVAVSWNSWIADITHNSLSLAVAPRQGHYGVVGFSFLWVDYGEFLGTMVWNNSRGFIDTENFSPRAMAIGLGYGKSLTDKFSVGGQMKYVTQSAGRSVTPDINSPSGLGVAKSVLSVIAFDFGTIYQTGFKSLAFGMSVRNFSEEIKFEQEGFQLPLTFRIGLAMNLMDFWEQYSQTHALLLAVDAVHPRSHGEYLSLGLEYTLLKLFALRAGYISNQDEFQFTYGLGIHKFGLSVDYAYMPAGVFDDVQRITISFSR